MTYSEATDFLFNSLPMFQNIGAHAYKPGLDSTLRLAEAFGNPHLGLRAVHVAGTNGKGSTSSLIAASLTAAGHRTALYTSPHLLDFRERIRIDGAMISEAEVVDFVERYRAMDLGLTPSFFELTTIMAFEWFARQGVDFAVIEVGLGGRLDSTNILTPLCSVITNISPDHTALLGNTPAEIAAEKAGIIKPGIPVFVGEAEGEVRQVFADTAQRLNAPITFIDHPCSVRAPHSELQGAYQLRNEALAATVLRHLGVSEAHIQHGFSNVCSLSGLMGRWMTVASHPLTVCDTGHNIGGWQHLAPQIATLAPSGNLHMVIGFVSDKDVTAILRLMPRNATYYFTQASVRRAMSALDLRELAAAQGLKGRAYPSVAEAYAAARTAAEPESDAIFVGGSTFIVADLLAFINSDGC